jgi:hypothetical protein
MWASMYRPMPGTSTGLNRRLGCRAIVAVVESGLLHSYEDQPASGLIAAAWRDAAEGMNRIIDVYALGTPARYSQIDAASYDPQYRR